MACPWGRSVVILISDSLSATVITVSYVISWEIRPCYNGTWLYYTLSIYLCQTCHDIKRTTKERKQHFCLKLWSYRWALGCLFLFFVFRKGTARYRECTVLHFITLSCVILTKMLLVSYIYIRIFSIGNKAIPGSDKYEVISSSRQERNTSKLEQHSSYEILSVIQIFHVIYYKHNLLWKIFPQSFFHMMMSCNRNNL